MSELGILLNKKLIEYDPKSTDYTDASHCLAQFIHINSPAQCHGLLSMTGQFITLGNVFILLGGREATPDTL